MATSAASTTASAASGTIWSIDVLRIVAHAHGGERYVLVVCGVSTALEGIGPLAAIPE
jgi:hypothetical protein